MAFSHSPKIATDGLVFYYDTGNGKSYKGEPTTNILNNTITAQGNGATLGEDSFGTYIQLPNITSGYSRFQLPSIPVSSNDIYTWSFELYTTETFTTGYSWDTNEYSDQYPSSNDLSRLTYTHSSPSTIPAGEWTPFRLTVTMKDGLTGAYTYDFFRFFFPTFQNKKVYYRNMQFEFKDHKTQYVGQGGSRSVTQGLLDLTKNSTINITDLDFNSNAEVDFDGTDGGLIGVPVNHSYLDSSAIEVLVNPNTLNPKDMVGGYRHNGGYSLPTIGAIYINDNRFNASVITSAEVYRTITSSTITANQYYHVVFNKDTAAGIMEMYVNGVSQGTVTFDAATYGQWSSAGNYIGTNTLDIGRSTNTNAGQGWGTSTLDGQIPIFKVYSKTLSADEVAQNYNAIKNRFGI